MGSGDYVTREMCGEIHERILAKLDSIEQRLFKDNGTLSIQTRIEKHEQILRVLVWASAIVVGTVLSSAVLGLVVVCKWAWSHGGAV